MAKLSLSVPQEVKINRSTPQPNADATVSRQSPTNALASRPKPYWELGLPNWCTSTSRTVSATSPGTGVVAA